MPLIHSEPLFSGYHRPIYLDDPWIRGWWILDNISVSGYDSKNFWDLQVSGSPVQAPGFIRTSGMRFDGTDDALLVDVSTTTGNSTNPIVDVSTRSGLWPIEEPTYMPQPNSDYISNTQLITQFGFLMRLKITDFPGIGLEGTPAVQQEHRVLISAWEGSGTSFTNYTRQFNIAIVNPSSIKVTVHSRTAAASYLSSIYSLYPHNIPSGEYFTLGASFLNATADTCPIIIVSGSGINTKSYIMHGTSNISAKASGASSASPAPSKIQIGCLGAGRYPSGFFKGDIEEIMWFNGGTPKLSDYYAFHSGNIQTTREELNKIDYPYLTANYRMERFYSGVVLPGTYGWIAEGQSGLMWFEDHGPNKLHLIVSGTLAIDKGSGESIKKLPLDGPYPGLYNVHYSGIGWSASIGGVRFLERQGDFCPPFNIAPPFGITIMYWMKHIANPASVYGVIGIENKSTATGITPWAVQWSQTQGAEVVNSSVNLGDNNGANGSVTAFSTNTSAYASGFWRHVAHTINFNTKTTHTFVSGNLSKQSASFNIESDKSGLWLSQVYTQKQTYLKLFGRMFITTSEGVPSGAFDEFIIIGDALPSSMINRFYTTNSGFLRPASPITSGEIGGYLNGIPIPTSSGYIGGYLSGIPLYSSGYIGGYLFGVYNNSGLIGGYLNGITLETPYSGLIGGYLRGLTSGNDLIGGYIRGQLPTQQQSGIIGGYMAGVEDISLNATFYAFFNVIGRDKKEFDAAATIFKEAKAEFDARAVVYIDERYPTATIINPSIDQSGNSTPITYQFEATASGLDNKQIVFTQWFFSDIPITSGSIISNSGTYQTSHTFSKSGLFDVIFIAIDDKGLVTSDRRKINTASGLTLPTITLTATTQSGVAPLSVGFSGVINTAPSPIKDKFIYFGDNTMSVSTDSIYKLYIVPGIYIPIFRVRDGRGIIVTDSLVVGVDN